MSARARARHALYVNGAYYSARVGRRASGPPLCRIPFPVLEPIPLCLPFPVRTSVRVCRSVGPLVPSPIPLPPSSLSSPASVLRRPLPLGRHNKQPRLLVNCRSRYCYVRARARTHARTMHARPRRHSMLAAVSHDSFCGKKKRTSGGEGEAFISSAREEQKDGAPRAACLAAAQFCFASCVHVGSSEQEGTTLTGWGDGGGVRERERKIERGIGAIDSW